MADPIRIVFIANCGLMIQSPQAKVLVDGLYLLERNIAGECPSISRFQHGDLFNPIPNEILDRIVNGSEEFQKIDSLLFTHCHSDHFSSEKTRSCLGKNKIASIFLPDDDHPERLAVMEVARKNGMSVFDMHLPSGIIEEQIINDMSIKYFRTAHSGKGYSTVAHYCFLISVNDKKIYISGDADYTNDYQGKMLEGEAVSIGFFNPLYLHQRTGRELINAINPKHVIVYHVPFENNDKYGFRKNLQKSMDRFAGTLPPCDIVSSALQTFYL